MFSFRTSLTSALESEFSTDEVYLDKIRNLSAKFSDIRRTRPDGNCFFRYECRMNGQNMMISPINVHKIK